MQELKQLEELFYRFELLKHDIDRIKGIVQNPMCVSEEQVNDWVIKGVAPTRMVLDGLIIDVISYYAKLEPCAWCGERHPGGPEYCKN